MHIYLFGNRFYYIKKYIIKTLFLGPTSLLPDNVWPKLTLGRLKNSTWTSILVSPYFDLGGFHILRRQIRGRDWMGGRGRGDARILDERREAGKCEGEGRR